MCCSLWDWWTYNSGPVHTCRAGHYDEFEICVFSDSIFLSLTFSFLRGVVQSITLERYLFLPFLAGFRGPSSEKLTGPVQFPVSSPLSRLNCCALVRKWVSLFGIFFVLIVQTSNAYNQTHVFTHKTHTFAITDIHIYIKGDQLFGSRKTVNVWHQTWLEWIFS